MPVTEIVFTTEAKRAMPCKTLTQQEVQIELAVLPEDIPVIGNACCSGDKHFDRLVENEILAHLEKNDVWAWATVGVSVEWEGQSSTEYLGCCCYQNEEDFRNNSGYFEEMVDEALANLNKRLHMLYEKLSAK